MRHSFVEGDTSAFCRVFVIQPNMERLAAPKGGGERGQKNIDKEPGFPVCNFGQELLGLWGWTVRFDSVLYILCVSCIMMRSHTVLQIPAAALWHFSFCTCRIISPCPASVRAPLSLYKSAGEVVGSQRIPGTHVQPHPGFQLPTVTVATGVTRGPPPTRRISIGAPGAQ